MRVGDVLGAILFFAGLHRHVVLSRMLFETLFEKDSVVLPTYLPSMSTRRYLYLFSSSFASCDTVLAANGTILAKRSHLKWRVSNNMSVRHSGLNAIQT